MRRLVNVMDEPRMTQINYISELNAEEKDRLLGLILDRIGCDLWAYKLDGEPRIIQIMARVSR